jgi:hypothetical protein
MRLAGPIAIAILAGLLLAGCGGSASDSTQGGSTATRSRAPSAPVGAVARSCETQAVGATGMRATGVSCARARQVMYGWQRDSRCGGANDASHNSCTTSSYRCIGTRTGRGVAVSCARPGESIAFTVRR